MAMAMATITATAKRMAKGGAAVKKQAGLFQLVLLILGTLGLAVATGVNAVENAARAGNPSATLRTSPRDAGALAAQADALLLSPDGKLDHGRALQLSRAALKDQAVEPRALRMLAFALDKPPTEAQTAKLIDLSARVSRRDLWARIWLNEKSAISGDVRATLGHYDIALRTSPTSGGQLMFPILSAALAEAEVQNELAPYIKKDAPWILGFVQYVTANQKELRPLANTIVKAGGFPSNPKYASQNIAVMRLLENGAAYTELRQIHAATKGADPKSLVTAELSPANTDPKFAGIAWTFPESQGARASAALIDGKHRIIAIAAPSSRAVVARKLLYLPPGSYAFTSVTRFISTSPSASAQWVLKCGGGASASAMTINFTPATTAPLAASLSIRPGCAPQYLDLFIRTESGGSDTELNVDSVVVRPTSG